MSEEKARENSEREGGTEGWKRKGVGVGMGGEMGERERGGDKERKRPI